MTAQDDKNLHHLRRREALVALVSFALSWPLQSFAQSTTNLPLVAVLFPGTPEIAADFETALRIGLKDGGYVEGTNFAFAMRYARGDPSHFAPLAAEIAALKPRVILAGLDRAVMEAHAANPATPVVMVAMSDDPVKAGLVQSFAHPGGRVTGNVLFAGGFEAMTGKRLGLLKELVPGIKRIGSIEIADEPTFPLEQRSMIEAGARLGIDVLHLPVTSLAEIEAAFTDGVRDGADSFYVPGLPLTTGNGIKVAELATRAGKPTVGSLPKQARDGLLMSYDPDLSEAWHSGGAYAAKILAGAKPGDLPIDQTSKFLFVINLKTAKALGIEVPPRLMLLADELVE